MIYLLNILEGVLVEKLLIISVMQMTFVWSDFHQLFDLTCNIIRFVSEKYIGKEYLMDDLDLKKIN